MKIDLMFFGFLVCFGGIFLGINCISLGLISPIEVVEEWGCHDTEIRLTCGHLDSKLAVLEATFTPNCTQDDCLRLDIKRLARVFSTTRFIDPRIAEAEAGRKFLETLRKTNDEVDDDDVEDADEVSADEDRRTVDLRDSPRVGHLVDHKMRRTSLKASLERLIIRYLRKLSPSDDLDFHVKRSARSRRDSTFSSATERVVLGVRNITLNENILNSGDDEEKRYRMVQESRSVCDEQKRKVSSLDRFDIENSLKNESEDEYNIRKILNRRCSGRNHCSFLFALDHPFSKVWDSGVVRVKYICMEDFRIKQYCNEQLTIGYEVSPEIHIDDTVPTKGEPVAEARFQPQDQSYHSLKILKTSDDVEIVPGLLNSASRKRKIKLQTAKSEEIRKEKPGVYSQDFKILKILPSNLDDFNDIEQIGDEIYFRTNDEILNAPEPTASTQPHLPTRQTFYSTTLNNDILPSPHSTSNYLEKLQESTVTLHSGDDYTGLPSENQNFSKFENITLIIREGEQYIITYPIPRILDNMSVNASTRTPHPTSYHISAPDGMSTVSSPTEASLKTTVFDEREEQDNMSNSRHFGAEEPKSEVPPKLDDMSAEASNNEYEGVSSGGGDHRLSELSENFYDDDDDESGRMSYSSIQRTFYGKPLLHGFAMSPGYPKFYIGDYVCKWVISAPAEQKIRVTILDLSLRYDCKDFVEISDLKIGRSLYNSCSESVRPMEIISDSNQIEIIMKSTTRFAYPKRGLLLHYSALGCVSPPPPKNGRLVNRTEMAAFYECQTSFVFPDSGVNNRQLVCTERHTWDRILPDCVEELAISGSGIISSFNLGSRKKTSPHTTKMSEKEADLVYDIIIPAVIISGLFIANAIVFVIILRYRRSNKNLETENVELAEL